RPPSPAPGGVAAVAACLARQLESLDLVTEALPVPGAGPLLRGSGGLRWLGHGGRAPSPPPRPVMLLGPLDTVWPLGTLASRPLRIEDGRLYGPGAFDMK